MERRFPLRNFRKFGYTLRGCPPFFRKFRILGDPGAASRDDAVFSGERYFQAKVYFTSGRALFHSRLAAPGSPRMEIPQDGRLTFNQKFRKFRNGGKWYGNFLGTFQENLKIVEFLLLLLLQADAINDVYNNNLNCLCSIFCSWHS